MAERDAGIAWSLSSCVPVGGRTERLQIVGPHDHAQAQQNLPAQRSAVQAGQPRSGLAWRGEPQPPGMG